jgi:hypothetical protein
MLDIVIVNGSSGPLSESVPQIVPSTEYFGTHQELPPFSGRLPFLQVRREQEQTVATDSERKQEVIWQRQPGIESGASRPLAPC